MSVAAEIYVPPTAESKGPLAILATLTPMMVFGEAGPEPIIEKIRQEVLAAPVDISTTRGRDAVASFAYKIARSKTALDDMGKQLVAEWKSKSSAVDAERKLIRDSLDVLKDDFRKPLTDWENAEKERIDAHETALAAIPESANYGQTETAAEFAQRLGYLLSYPDRDWQEYSARATKVLSDEIARTRLLLSAAEHREAERAELDRLRAAEQERQAKELAEQKARDAEKREIEAQAERQRIAEHAAEIERQRLEQQQAAREEEHARELDAAERAGKTRSLACRARKKRRSRQSAPASRRPRRRIALRLRSARPTNDTEPRSTTRPSPRSSRQD